MLMRTFMEFQLNYSIVSLGILLHHEGNLLLLKDSDSDGNHLVILLNKMYPL